MKTRGLVIDERRYKQVATPPDSFDDASRFGNNGTHTAITWVQQPSGLWARSFVRATSVVNLGTNKSLEIQKHTVEYWMNITTMTAAGTECLPYQKYVWNASGYRTVFDGWIIKHDIFVPGQTYAQIANFNTWVAEGEWHHYADVYDGTFIKMYIDATQRVSNNVGAVTVVHNSTIALKMGQTIGNGITGLIALFRIHNYVLSPGQLGKHVEAERNFFGV